MSGMGSLMPRRAKRHQDNVAELNMAARVFLAAVPAPLPEQWTTWQRAAINYADARGLTGAERTEFLGMAGVDADDGTAAAA